MGETRKTSKKNIALLMDTKYTYNVGPTYLDVILFYFTHQDPVACAFLTRPELLHSLLDQDTLKYVHERHPGNLFFKRLCSLKKDCNFSVSLIEMLRKKGYHLFLMELYLFF